MTFLDRLSDLVHAAPSDRVTLLANYLKNADIGDAGVALYLLAGGRPGLRLGARRAKQLAETFLADDQWQKSKAAGADALETLCLLLPDTRGNGVSPGDMPELLHPASRVGNDRILDLIGRVPLSERPGLIEILSGRVGRIMPVSDIWQALACVQGQPVEQVRAAWFADQPPYHHLLGWLSGRCPAPHAVRSVLPGDFQPVSDVVISDDLWQSTAGGWVFGPDPHGIRVQLVTGAECMIVDQTGRNLTSALPDVVAEIMPCQPMLFDGYLHGMAPQTDEAKSQVSRRLNSPEPGPALVRNNPVCITVHDLLANETENLVNEAFRHRYQLLRRWADGQSLTRVRTLAWQPASAPATAHLMARNLAAPCGFHRVVADAKTVVAIVLYVKLNTRTRAVDTLVLGAEMNGEMVAIADVQPVFGPGQQQDWLVWTRQNAIEKFGPVHSVPPERLVVFTYRDLVPAPRRKAGFRLVNPAFVEFAEIGRDVDIDCLRADLDQMA